MMPGFWDKWAAMLNEQHLQTQEESDRAMRERIIHALHAESAPPPDPRYPHHDTWYWQAYHGRVTAAFVLRCYFCGGEWTMKSYLGFRVCDECASKHGVRLK